MIEVRNLTREFSKKEENSFGIFDVSFDIPDNKIIGFIGPNGAGKTTTIKSIFGEVNLESGQVYLDGLNIWAFNRLQKVAFFPDINNIPLNMKVKDYIDYNCAAHGLFKSNYIDKLEKIYNFLDMKKHINKKLSQLSSGLKKKAITASILVLSPKYLILDEPTSNLDINERIYFLDMIKVLNKKFKVTIFVTSHVFEELQDLLDHLIIIDYGRIVYDKPFNNKKDLIIDIYKRVTKNTNYNLDKIEKIYGEEI